MEALSYFRFNLSGALETQLFHNYKFQSESILWIPLSVRLLSILKIRGLQFHQNFTPSSLVGPDPETRVPGSTGQDIRSSFYGPMEGHLTNPGRLRYRPIQCCIDSNDNSIETNTHFFRTMFIYRRITCPVYDAPFKSQNTEKDSSRKPHNPNPLMTSLHAYLPGIYFLAARYESQVISGNWKSNPMPGVVH